MSSVGASGQLTDPSAVHHRPERSARIGPNAILQYVPVLAAQLGDVRMRALLQRASIDALPDGTEMIDEAQVRRLHQTIRSTLPDSAPTLARQAGVGTADYIMRHRIPALAKPLLRWLPRRAAEFLLARAVSQHAWTFCGSGAFRIAGWSPLTVEIQRNPLVLGEQAEDPICDWHAAVFEHLFSRLLGRSYSARELHCGACSGNVCRFEITVA